MWEPGYCIIWPFRSESSISFLLLGVLLLHKFDFSFSIFLGYFSLFFVLLLALCYGLLLFSHLGCYRCSFPRFSSNLFPFLCHCGPLCVLLLSSCFVLSYFGFPFSGIVLRLIFGSCIGLFIRLLPLCCHPCCLFLLLLLSCGRFFFLPFVY